MTLKNVALAPKEIDGWEVTVNSDNVEMRKDGRYLKVGGEAWLSADTLVHRGLELAAANDEDLATKAEDREIHHARRGEYRAMAEALVMRDRAAVVLRRGEK